MNTLLQVNISIENSMKETKSGVKETFDFENGDGSTLSAIIGNFGSSVCWIKDR